MVDNSGLLTCPGLETIHLLTLRKNYELRVDMEDFDGMRVHANYSSFSISPGAVNAEVDGYRLHVSGFRNGGAGQLWAAGCDTRG